MEALSFIILFSAATCGMAGVTYAFRTGSSMDSRTRAGDRSVATGMQGEIQVNGKLTMA